MDAHRGARRDFAASVLRELARPQRQTRAEAGGENGGPSPDELYAATLRAAEQAGLEVIPTCCFSCNTACEVLAFRDMASGSVVKIEGDPASPITRGFACPKGLSAFDLLYNSDRLTTPLRRIVPRAGRGEDAGIEAKKGASPGHARGRHKESPNHPGWEEISWDEALDEIASRLLDYRAQDGARSIAFLEGTRRGWSRVYSRLANAFGAPNHGAAGWAQCLWPRLVDCRVTFGAQYSEACDFPHTRAVLAWGVNPPQTWPVQSLEIMEARERGAKLIVIDPRLSETAAKADLWLRIKPGADTDLALGFIEIIIREELYDREFVRNWTIGFDALRDSLAWRTPQITESLTGIPAAAIVDAARMYASTKPACLTRCVTVDQTLDSVQLCRALSILTALTGNIDIPGGNILCSSRGEISQNSHDFILARNISADIAKERRGYEKFPLLCGELSPVPSAHMPTLWSTIRSGAPYEVKAALIFGSNAVLSYSNSKAVTSAMEKLEFIAVCDMFMTSTAEMADIVLPASSWLERDNVISSFQTSTEHTVIQQKCESIGQSRSDVDIICDLARKLGLGELFWKDSEALYDYLLSPTGLTLKQARARRRLSAPLKFGQYLASGFKTPSGKVELYSSLLERVGSSPLPRGTDARAALAGARKGEGAGEGEPVTDARFPFHFSTGARSLFFRHTENRRNSYLMAQEPQPLAYIHPDAAASIGARDGDPIEIVTETGSAILRARLDPSISPDTVEAVPGWGGAANINTTIGWNEFAEGIGTVPMRGLRCDVRKA